MNCAKIEAQDSDAAVICRKLAADRVAEREKITTPQAVYSKAIDVAVEESRRNFGLLTQSKKRPSDFPRSPFLKFLKEKANMTIPFVFDDLDPIRATDANLLHAIASHQFLLHQPFSYYWFVGEKGPIGIQFDAAVQNKTSHALEAAAAKRGNCLEFIYLYYGMSLLLGQTIQVLDQYDIKDRAHVVVRFDGVLLDPEDGLVTNAPTLKEISRLDLVAYSHYNRALGDYCQKRIPRERLACEERELKKAERYAPGNFRIQYALYHLYFEKKAPPAVGERHLRISLTDNPAYEPAQTALKILEEARSTP